MSLVGLLILILVLMLIFWLIDELPGDARFKKMAKIVLIVIMILVLLGGITLHVPTIQVR